MESLKKSIQSVIDKDRIGSPVFLRGILNIGSKESSLLQPAAELVALSNTWIPSQPQIIYVQGEVNATQITTMVKYTTGQMAMLGVNRVDTETAIDIMLVGNKGVIYHETPIGQHYLSGTPLKLDGFGELSEVITRSITSGKPITVERKQ